MGDHALHRVEEGLAQTRHDPFDAALDHAAHRVALGCGRADDLFEAVQITASAHLDQPGREADAFPQHLLGNDACSHECHGQAGREVPSAARVVEPSELAAGDQVGV